MAEHPVACPAWQDDLAGLLVAQLPPDREAALRAHLEGCPACRAEADSLLAVAATALAVPPPPTDAAGPPHAPPALGERIAGAVRAERGARQRARAIVAGAAVAGLVALVVAAATLAGSRDGGGPPDPAGTPVAFAVVPPGASASAVVSPDDGGAVVSLRASGLDPDVTYALWLTAPGASYDERTPAGTFRPEADGTVDVRLASALPAADAHRVWATTPSGEVALDTEPPH